MGTGVGDIRELDHLHTARLQAWDQQLPLDQQSSALPQRHRDLETKLSEMPGGAKAHLQESELHPAQPKVRSRLHNPWEGLTVCVTRPEVAMDNNTAERI